MWYRIALRYTAVALSLAWAFMVYYRYLRQPAGATSPAEIHVGQLITVMAGIGMYSALWYLLKARTKLDETGFHELPALIITTLCALVASSFLIAFGAGNFQSYLANNLEEIGYLFSIILACFYIGDKLVERLGLELAGAERIFMSVTAGLGLMAVFVFVAGVFEAFYAAPMRLAIFVLAICGMLRAAEVFKTGALEKLRLSTLPNPLSLVIAFFLGSSFLVAWGPTWSYDSLLYHVAVPKFYILSHKIYYIRDFLPANYPLNGEMLFLLGLILKNDAVVQLLTYFFAVWVLLGVYVFAERFYSRRAAILATALMLSVSSFAYQVSVNNNDTILALFTLAGVFGLLAWNETRNDKWLVLGGLMLGFAAGSKYTGYFILTGASLVTAAIVVLANAKNQERSLDVGKSLAAFFLAASVGVGPWLLKNYVFTGNPTYPVFMSLFGGRDWHPAATALFTRTVRGANHIAVGPLGDLSVLWYLTFKDPLAKSIGPAFLSFVPLVLRDRLILRPTLLIPAAIALGLFIPYSLLLAQTANYALPGMVLMVLIVGAGIDNFLKDENWAKFLVVGFILTAIVTNTFMLFKTKSQSIPIGLAQVDRAEFMKDNGLYQISKEIIRQIPPSKKLAMIVDNRAYYLNKREILMLSPLDNGRIDQVGINSPDELCRIFKRERVAFVFATDEVRRYTYALPKGSPFGDIYRPLVENVDGLIADGRLAPVIRYGDFWVYKFMAE